MTASVKVLLQAIDQITGPIKKIQNNINAFARSAAIRSINQSASKMVQSFQNVGHHAGRLATNLTVLAGVSGFAFKHFFLDTAIQFEKFETILETTEGSAQKAQKSMQWVSAFATETPYELDEVTEAFVKLRAYGLNPMTGLLKDLGDTSAAMGKPLMQSVEAIADAVTGENERLKEFGIKARKEGGKITYEFTNKLGKQMTRTVSANNRAMIESTLRMIWNEKYGGAMSKLSSKFGGMWSNMMDQWTRFSNMVMDGGVFDFLKEELRQLLEKINEMAASGELEQVAKQVAGEIKTVLLELKTAFQQIWPLVTGFAAAIAFLADIMGGYNNLVKVVVGIMSVPFVASILSAVGAIGGFIATLSSSAVVMEALWALLGVGLALLELPLIPIAAIGAAVVALGVIIHKFIDDLFGWQNVIDGFLSGLSNIGQALGLNVNHNVTHSAGKGLSPAKVPSSPLAQASSVVQLQPKKDTLNVKMTMDVMGRPRIAGVNMLGDSNLNFDADLGMMGAY